MASRRRISANTFRSQMSCSKIFGSVPRHRSNPFSTACFANCWPSSTACKVIKPAAHIEDPLVNTIGDCLTGIDNRLEHTGQERLVLKVRRRRGALPTFCVAQAETHSGATCIQCLQCAVVWPGMARYVSHRPQRLLV